MNKKNGFIFLFLVIAICAYNFLKTDFFSYSWFSQVNSSVAAFGKYRIKVASGWFPTFKSSEGDLLRYFFALKHRPKVSSETIEFSNYNSDTGEIRVVSLDFYSDDVSNKLHEKIKNKTIVGSKIGSLLYIGKRETKRGNFSYSFFSGKYNLMITTNIKDDYMIIENIGTN